ncbi:SDR family NAD(P)-dependent oxidoreductase [bacterium]|nr:SDR family NAD(P)-dependent oxidoreductase [bacterium]MCI0566334.1 SDR family NAD(P)-dependent oxidoreductase [bacterium]
MKAGKKNLFIIFGTTRGLGEALFRHASRFDKNEFTVINRVRISHLPSNANGVMLDLSKSIRIKKLDTIFQKISPRTYSAIFLINNAGTVDPIGTVGTLSPDDMNKAWRTNIINYSIITNDFIRRTASIKGTSKKILNISSGAAVSPTSGLGMYCGAKAALEMLTECIFLEQAKTRQVQVLAFRPGVMDTDMQRTMRGASKKEFDRVVVYRALAKKGALISPKSVAEKIYSVLETEKYWEKPILNINEIK